MQRGPQGEVFSIGTNKHGNNEKNSGATTPAAFHQIDSGHWQPHFPALLAYIEMAEKPAIASRSM